MAQAIDDLGVDPPPLDQVGAAGVGVEQHVELVGGSIAHGDDDVGVHDVVDERHVLVADALDVVLAEAVLEQRRALQGLGGHDARPVALLQPVAGADGAGRARGRHEGRQAQVRTARPATWSNTAARAAAVTSRWARWLPNSQNWLSTTLVGVGGQHLAGVVDLLDVALAPRRAHHVGRVGHPAVEPVEALLRHALGQDGHAPAAHDAADGHAAAGVVARARPHGAVHGRVELPRDDAGRQAGVRGQDLVGRDHREAPRRA